MDVKKLLNNRTVNTGIKMLKNNMMIILTILVFLIFTVTTGGVMIRPASISLLLQQNAYIVVLAVGMLICILTGGNIDLSIGSMLCLIGTIAGVLMVGSGVSFWLAFPICMIIGLLLGAWQGFWIAYMRIPAFIVTLAGMLLFRGVAQLIDLRGYSGFPDIVRSIFGVQVFPGGIVVCWIIASAIVIGYVGYKLLTWFKRAKKGLRNEHIAVMIINCALVSGAVLFLAYSFAESEKGMLTITIILAAVILAYSYFTNKTVYGRQIYAIGGNEKAAKLSGINTNKMIFFAYVNMAFLVVIASFLELGRVGASYPTSGQNYEMDAIAACYIGGASAYGGKGKVSGVVIGAIFMGILKLGMNMLMAPEALTLVVRAVVLLAGVAFDIITKRRGKTA